MYTSDNTQVNQVFRFLVAAIAIGDQKPHYRQQRIRLNRLHNDPEHLKEMIERETEEDLGVTMEDKQKRMKTQPDVKQTNFT
jgi:hypothetical protein